MKNPLRWLALGIAFVVAAFGVALATQVGTNPTYSGGELLQRQAPDFDLPLLEADGAADGERVSLAGLAGKSGIVKFWNSWCLPCRAEAPTLVEFWEAHRDEGDFAMVGIVRDEELSGARKGAIRDGFEWILAADPNGKAAIAFATTGQPETFAISPSGVVTGLQLSEVSIDNLEALLASARAG